jgi:hypothetical protein
MLSQNKLGDSMKSITALTAVAITTLSLVAVAADKPAETKPADKPATTASAPVAKADSKEKPHPKVITPKEKAAKKAEAETSAKK